MDILIDEHRQFLKLLLKHNVKFMLIGGYAVIYHGYERLTGDMDIWLEPTNENRDLLTFALTAFGIEDEDVKKVSQTNFTEPQIFFIGKVPRRIDFLTKITGINFTEANEQVNFFFMQDLKIPVIHYHHLLISKTNTGRLKDKADIEELERINRYKT